MSVTAFRNGILGRHVASRSELVTSTSTYVRLVAAMVAYVAAFLFFSNIGIIAAGYTETARPMVPDPPGLTYPVSLLALVSAALVCVAVWAYSTVWLHAVMVAHTTMLAAVIASLSYVAALLASWATWSFNLDDKYIFLRTTRNLVTYGLPYWNPGERLNVQTSLIWPYLTAPGILLGDWELFARIVGVLSFVLTSVVFALQVRDVLLRAVAVSAVILFLPLLLWSMGTLETSFATLVLIATAWLAFRRGLNTPLVWLVFGSMAFIRPDVVLVGMGAGAIYGLFGGGALPRRILMGLLLVAPILSFIAINLALFDFPFPRPFYIKGWNKSFSGHYPLYVDISVGMSHLLSALSLSPIWLIFIGVFWRRIRQGRSAWRLDELALAAGALAHLAYIVVAGYQHMNYTFRYFIPSMMLLLFVAIVHTDRAITAGTIRPHSLLMRALVWGCLFIQMPFFGWTTYHANWHEMALTFTPLRDRFSVQSLASYMRPWIEAGEYLKQIEKPGDRLFQWRNIGGSAMTDMYLMDQYYAPPTLSSIPEVRDCQTSIACVRVYDYLMIPAEPEWAAALPTHLVVRRYDNLWIMKRATRVVDDQLGAPTQAMTDAVRVVEVHESGDRTGTVDGHGLRLAASPSEPAWLKLRINGLKDPSTIIVTTTIRVDGADAPLAQLTLKSGQPVDSPPTDEVVGTGAWVRMGVAAEDGHWPDGVAMIELHRTGGDPTGSLEVREIQVVVDDQTALVLTAEQLEALVR